MSGWNKVAVGDLGKVVTGKTPKTSVADNYGEDIPFLTPSDDMSVKYVKETNKHITEQGKKTVKNVVLPAGSVCVSCIGSDLGKVVMTTAPETITNQQINSIIVNETKFDAEFVYYAMLILGKTLNYHSKTSTAVPIVNKSSFSQYYIDCPELREQKKIAYILSKIDKKIEINNEINNNLLQQLGSIYKELYPYQPSDSLPKGWQCVSLGSLCDSISIKHSFDKEELIFLNTGDVEDGCFLHDNYSLVKEMPGQAKKSIMLGDILYSEIRPINRHFAFVNFAADDYVVSTKLMVIRSRGIASRRLYHFLTTQDVIDELQLEAESRSGTFPQIRFENVQRLPIIIAPPEIETKFAGILELYYRTIDSNIKENKNLIAVRDSLLPRIMSGELDVSNIDI